MVLKARVAYSRGIFIEALKDGRRKPEGLANAEMLEVVARLDALGPPERCVVEIDPRWRDLSILECNRGDDARVKAGIGLARTIAFDVVEGVEHSVAVQH